MIYSKKHIAIDFNSYNLPKTFAIKELSAIVGKKDPKLSDPNLHLLIEPPCQFEDLPPKCQTKYTNFYEIHAIAWERGTVAFKNLSKILKRYFKNTKHIYVKNTLKKKILESLIGEREDIKCLEDLGFKENPEKSNSCPHHDVPSICAVANSEAMLIWLKKYRSEHKNAQLRLPENRVFIQVSIKGQIFNALLDTGSTATCIRSLDDNLLKVAGVSNSDRKSATGADGHLMKIESSVQLPLVINDETLMLDVRVVPTLGYEMILGIDAINAFGIGLDGTNLLWWTKHGSEEKEMIAVIDFCGYRIPDDKYAVKEFSIIYIRDNKIVKKIFNIIKPPCEWHSLKPETQQEYEILKNKYGINFKTGLCNYNISICVLNKYLKHMKTVYVINETKKEFLEKYILKSFKNDIACLEKIGYDFEEKLTTECGNHENPDKNNCVNDNAIAMTDWVLKYLIKHQNDGNNVSEENMEVTEESASTVETI